MWTLAEYLPVALFSLKPAVVTSSGGRTLLCPTPFACKMALLDVALRTLGKEQGKQQWQQIRDLRLMVRLPQHMTVINTFTKIVRPKKAGITEDGDGLMTPFNSTIAYREYVAYSGAFGLAAQTADGQPLPPELENLFVHVTYLGKRGGFVQLLAPPTTCADETLSAEQGWVLLTADQTSFASGGTVQLLDDCSPKLTFEQVDIYSGKRMSLDKDRIRRHIVLPYQQTRSSRGFTLYERIAQV
jgi:hypothetical protein